MKQKYSFTLVELVMTIVILSVIGIPLSLLLSQFLVSSAFNEDLTYAAQLGRWELERTAAATFDNINSQFLSQYQGYRYDLDKTVEYLYGGVSSQESLKKITIRVYPYQGTRVLAEFVTARAKNAAF